MARYLAPISLLLGSLLSVSGAPTPPKQGGCQDVFFQVEAEATNRQVVVPPDFSTPAGALAFLNQPNLPNLVRGSETIYGRYCTSPLTHARPTAEAQTLQVLVHGNTYDSGAWRGAGDAYSWEAAARARGYDTLALDRLGAGRSSHPDPLTHVQGPYQVELLHQVLQQIRKGDAGVVAGYERLVWVGHSYGSILATNLAAKYPADIDAYVLTGLAVPKPGDNAAPGQLQMAFVPAAAFDPVRFPPLRFPPGYLVTANKAGRAASFYGDPATYDRAILEADFADQSTLAAGEVLTQSTAPAPRFVGPVFVLTGQNDAVMCGNGTRAVPEREPDCGSGEGSQLAAVRGLFPAAERFDFYAQPNAGHVQMNHYSAKDGFQKAHDFLSAWLRGEAAR